MYLSTALALLTNTLTLTLAHPPHPLESRSSASYYPNPAFYSEVVKEYVSVGPGGTCTKWDVETVGVEAERRPRCNFWDKRLPTVDYLLRRVKSTGPLPCINWKVTQSKDSVTVEPVCDIPANKKYRPYHHKSMGPKPIHPENPEGGKEKRGKIDDSFFQQEMEEKDAPRLRSEQRQRKKGWKQHLPPRDVERKKCDIHWMSKNRFCTPEPEPPKDGSE